MLGTLSSKHIIFLQITTLYEINEQKKKKKQRRRLLRNRAITYGLEFSFDIVLSYDQIAMYDGFDN
jgi:hypothetical protein